ncbi:hypothetical protein [Streptomyces sp. NPDC048309]|uniref:hypothetical protein n=1 Tax=unclassified Streptomyces TaxID=2593676 RepID=UPI0033D6DA82
MTETLATKTSLPGYGMPGTAEAALAEALFASTLQFTESPSPDKVRRAVGTTLRRLGVRGCAARMAREFGDHPDTAVARMRWALETIHAAYPAPSMTPTPPLRPPALTS